MGNRLSKISLEKDCLICWEKIENKNIFVKCNKCRICLHSDCAFSYFIQISMTKCPHCQQENCLFYYHFENCNLL